jgi:hypothetical protein
VFLLLFSIHIPRGTLGIWAEFQSVVAPVFSNGNLSRIFNGSVVHLGWCSATWGFHHQGWSKPNPVVFAAKVSSLILSFTAILENLQNHIAG